MSLIFKFSVLIALSFLWANVKLVEGKLIHICNPILFYILIIIQLKVLKLSLSNITYSNVGLAFRAAGDGWSNCSKQTGYDDIDDVKDCRKFASDARKSFSRTESSSSSPKGCYLYRSRAVYYNFHNIGGERSDESPICLKSKQRT